MHPLPLLREEAHTVCDDCSEKVVEACMELHLYINKSQLETQPSKCTGTPHSEATASCTPNHRVYPCAESNHGCDSEDGGVKLDGKGEEDEPCGLDTSCIDSGTVVGDEMDVSQEAGVEASDDWVDVEGLLGDEGELLAGGWECVFAEED